MKLILWDGEDKLDYESIMFQKIDRNRTGGGEKKSLSESKVTDNLIEPEVPD